MPLSWKRSDRLKWKERKDGRNSKWRQDEGEERGCFILRDGEDVAEPTGDRIWAQIRYLMMSHRPSFIAVVFSVCLHRRSRRHCFPVPMKLRGWGSQAGNLPVSFLFPFLSACLCGGGSRDRWKRRAPHIATHP